MKGPRAPIKGFVVGLARLRALGVVEAGSYFHRTLNHKLPTPFSQPQATSPHFQHPKARLPFRISLNLGFAHLGLGPGPRERAQQTCTAAAKSLKHASLYPEAENLKL